MLLNYLVSNQASRAPKHSACNEQRRFNDRDSQSEITRIAKDKRRAPLKTQTAKVCYKYIVRLRHSLLPLVDLVQERLEHLPLEHDTACRRDRLRGDSLDEAHDTLIRRLLVLLVLAADAHLLVQRLDARLGLRVLAAVVGVEHGALRRRRERERGVDAPRALVVDDVRTDLAEELRGHRVVEEVVLHLEVLAERDEDALRERVWVVGLGVWDAAHVHRKRNREVEGVVRRLVDDDLLVPVRQELTRERETKERKDVLRKGEFAQIDVVFGCGNKVDKLPNLRLERRLHPAHKHLSSSHTLWTRKHVRHGRAREGQHSRGLHGSAS